jgi:hypothetical protein
MPPGRVLDGDSASSIWKHLDLGGRLSGDSYGYHDSFIIKVQGQETEVFYTAIQHPQEGTDEENFDKFTVRITHELVEMITDPRIDPTLSLMTTGWSDGNNKEIADVCEQLKKISFRFQGYQVTSFWSNQQQGCIDRLISVTLQVQINNIQDHVPGSREQQALVSAYPEVKVGDSYVVAGPGLTFKEDLLKTAAPVPIRVEIWRHTSQKVIHGKVNKADNTIVFDGKKYPLPDNWWDMTEEERADFSTRVITPQVNPGFVRGLDLIYNLTTQQFNGDAVGSAGNQIHVPQDPGNQYTPEFSFTITQI